MVFISREKIIALQERRKTIRKQQIAKKQEYLEKRKAFLERNRQKLNELKLKQPVKNTGNKKLVKRVIQRPNRNNLNYQQLLIRNTFNNINSNPQSVQTNTYNYSGGCKSCGG